MKRKIPTAEYTVRAVGIFFIDISISALITQIKQPNVIPIEILKHSLSNKVPRDETGGMFSQTTDYFFYIGLETSKINRGVYR